MGVLHFTAADDYDCADFIPLTHRLVLPESNEWAVVRRQESWMTS